jgi:hypothetical protein
VVGGGEMFYKLLVSCGHLGTNKEILIVRYFVAKDIIEAFECGNRMPRAKRKHNHSAVLLVKPISEGEYIEGKIREKRNSYLAAN